MRYETFYPFSNQSPQAPRHQPMMPNRSIYQNQGAFMPPNIGPQDSLANQNPFQQTGKGTSKLENYMQTADRFLSTAQQYAPVIQQFAPMISNLPSIWRLYKGFQSMPDRSSTPSSNLTASNTQNTASARQPATQNFQSNEPRPSVPRIFQPPNPLL